MGRNESQISTQHITQSTSLYFLSMVIPKAVGFFLLPILTRYLEPSDYGIISYTASVVGVITVFSALGLNAFYLRSYHGTEDKKTLNGTIFWFLGIWNICLLVIGATVVFVLMNIMQPPFDFFPYMFLAICTQFFNSFEIVPMRTFRITGDVKKYFYRIVAKTIVHVVSTLLFIIILDWGILGWFYAGLLNAFIFSIIFILYMLKQSYFKIDFHLLRKALKFAVPIIPSDLVQMGSPLVANIIIERILSLAQLGLYSIGITLSSVIHLVTNSIILSIEPLLYTKMYEPGFQTFFLRTKSYLLAISGIVCVFSGLFVREVSIILLPEKYWTVWPLVQIIAVSYTVQVLKGLYSNLLIVQGKTKLMVFSNIGNLVLIVVVNIILLPVFGERVLGLANLVGALAGLAIIYYCIDKSAFESFHMRKDMIYVLCCLAILYLSRFSHRFILSQAILIKLLIIIFFGIFTLYFYNIHLKEILLLLKRNK